MKVAIHDADRTRRPNLALLKLCAAHRARGDTVEWFIPLLHSEKQPDLIVYSSKVFSWSKEDAYLPTHAVRGGCANSLSSFLPEEIEHTCPDYSFVSLPYSMGFLTRGCPRACRWCIVPHSEGPIRAHADVDEFLRHRDVVLMDNNVLAHDHGIRQIEKMGSMDLRVDFNQGLDPRLVDRQIAARLAKLGWRHPLRLACDHLDQMKDVERAVRLLREAGVSPQRYFCYVLVDDIDDALERVSFLDSLKLDPFAQPLRLPFSTEGPSKILKHFARWCNHKAVHRTVPWHRYEPYLQDVRRGLCRL